MLPTTGDDVSMYVVGGGKRTATAKELLSEPQHNYVFLVLGQQINRTRPVTANPTFDSRVSPSIAISVLNQ